MQLSQTESTPAPRIVSTRRAGSAARTAPAYEPRNAEDNVLHRVVREHLLSFLEHMAERTDAIPKPSRRFRLDFELARVRALYASLTLEMSSSEQLDRRGALITVCTVALWLVGILLVVASSSLARPHLAWTIHFVSVAPGVLVLVLGMFIGWIANSPLIRLIALVLGAALGLFAEGFVVLINQYADHSPANVHVGRVISAKPQRMRVRSSNDTYDATTDLVVSGPDGVGTIDLKEPKYITGTYPTGTPVRLYIRPGALHFAWLEKYELGDPKDTKSFTWP